MRFGFKFIVWQYLIIVLGLCLTGISSWMLYQGEIRDTQHKLESDIENRAEALSRVLMSNIEPLHTVAALFEYQKVPSYPLFNKHVMNILARHEAIKAVEWAPKVSSSQRDQYERLMQRSFESFEFTQHDLNKKMVTSANRQEYFPVYYVAPYDNNKAAHGFDLASSPIRRDSIIKARTTGLKVATASINLVQNTVNSKDFLVFLPVYRSIELEGDSSLEQRFLGFIIGAYSINELFMQSEMIKQHMGIDLKLFDNIGDRSAELVWHHHSHTTDSIDSSFSHQAFLPTLYLREWSLLGMPSHSYVAAHRSYIPYAVALLGTLFTVIILFYFRAIASQTSQVQALVYAKTKELSAANQKLKRISRTDSLTKLANRRCMDIFFDKEWSRALRLHSHLSVIMIDIDNFKQYNDFYGHQIGDECLSQVASALANSVGRPSDMVARYGGEEFCLIIGCSEDVSIIAHRCLHAVGKLKIPHQLSPVSEYVTVSVGYSTVLPSRKIQSRDVFKAADKALYLAKSNGKNRVEKEVIQEHKELAIS